MIIKKYLSIFLSIFFVSTFIACEEDEAALLFSVENITDNNNVKLEYYSPDPCCVPKMYYIVANRLSSEMTLKCTNADNITLTALSAISDDNTTTNTSIAGRWTATIIDTNTIKLTIDGFSISSFKSLNPAALA